MGIWTYGVTEEEELSLLHSNGNLLWTFGRKVTDLCIILIQEDDIQSDEATKKSMTKNKNKDKNKNRQAKSSKSQNVGSVMTPKMEIFYNEKIIGELICELPSSDGNSKDESNVLELSMPQASKKDLDGEKPLTIVKV